MRFPSLDQLGLLAPITTRFGFAPDSAATVYTAGPRSVLAPKISDLLSGDQRGR